MSNTIDERIVEMKFDNKQFESNVKTTMSSLEKLKRSLNFKGATKGLEEIDSVANNINMSGLSKAVETIKTKFSALDVMAVTALANITNSAVNAGKKIVSALTIDPIKTGFSEYETKINSIQTIMSNTASKGTTMEDVTRVIDELNTYADKTIYNFAEMTKNIGTFTAAGVGLEDSAAAIQGIANLAAASGANTQKASTVMYQLSQALSTGTVKLMDWNSVVNAGMGGEKFQEALKDTAREHGVSVDEIIKSNGSFRDSLQEGWLSADILNSTLQKFTTKGAKEYADSMLESGKWTNEQAEALIKESKAMEDAATKVKTFTQLWDTLKESAQSGWSQTWEIIVGDFEEAKDLLTKVNDVLGKLIGNSADARNAVLKGWKDLGGRNDIIDAVKNSFEGIVSVIVPIKEAFTDIFPPITANQLINLTKIIKDITSNFKISESTANNLKRTFKGLFSILDIVKQAFFAMFKLVTPVIKFLSIIINCVLRITAIWGDWITNINKSIKSSNIFNNVMSGVTVVIESAITAISTFFELIKEKVILPGFTMVRSFFGNFGVTIADVGQASIDMKNKFVDSISSIGKTLSENKLLVALNSIWSGIKTVVGGIASAIGSMIGKLVEVFSNANFNNIFTIINNLIAGGIGVGLIKFIKCLTGTFDEIQGVTKNIVGIFDGVRGCFEAYQKQLKANTLMTIAGAIAILAASILVISLIDSKKLAQSLGAITVLFADLMVSMAFLGRGMGNTKAILKTCTSMISISVAVLILASALKKIGKLELDEIAKGLVGVAGLLTIMTATAKAMGRGSSTIIKSSINMVVFAIAIKTLAAVCKDLSSLNWDELAKGLVGVGVLLAEVSVFLNTIKTDGKTKTKVQGIILIAVAIKILASACSVFSKLEWSGITKGLVSIGVLLAELALFTKLAGNSKHIISTGISLIAIGAAMKILASAVRDMSTMSWEELGKGILSLAVSLLAVTIAIKFMPKNMIGIGIGLIAVSTSLVVMAQAVKTLGRMSWSDVGKGLVALGGSMAMLALGLNAMKGTLAGSAALLVASLSLAIMTPSLILLGKMSWSGIVKGLVTIAGAFAILGVAGLVLTPLVPVILALGASFTLIGIGITAAAAGVLLLSAGFTALAIAVSAGATTIVAGTTTIVTGLVGLIPVIIVKIGEGLLELCNVIVKGAPQIGRAFKALVVTIVDVLVDSIPAIADGLLKLLDGLVKALVKHTPSIVDSVFQFLISILNGISKNIPKLIKAAVGVFKSFLTGVVDSLNDIDTKVLLKGIFGIGLFSLIMIALASLAALTPAAMVGVLGMSVVIAELTILLAAIGALSQIPGLKWLVDEGGKLMQSIGTAIGSFLGGIVSGFVGGVSSQFPKIGTDLSNFMTNLQPFLEGAKLIDNKTLSGIKAISEMILILTAANVIDGLTSWLTGGKSITKFSEQLKPFGEAIKEFSLAVTGISTKDVEVAAKAGKILAEMASTLPNSGGFAGFFAGENDLEVFSEKLEPFGKAIKKFSSVVIGMKTNAEDVELAAKAGKILAEMASTLPDSGGLADFFAGENDLEVFSEKLIIFGKAIKKFSESVTGLNGDIVNNAAIAGKTMIELANTLPNTGGVVSWFAGDNDIKAFGENLKSFGESFASYSESMTKVDSGVIAATANAASSIIKLQESLPVSGGLFSNSSTLDSFGKDISKFGKHFSEYYGHTSQVSVMQLAGVIVETGNLLNLANSMAGVDTSGMFTFGAALTKLGESGLAGIIPSFSNLNSYVTEAAQTMMTSFINGISTNSMTLTTNFSLVLQSVITTIYNKQYAFNYSGITLMIQFIAGVRSKEQALISAFVIMTSVAISSIRNRYYDFYNAGSYLVDGFAAGIKDNTYKAENSAREMSRAASKAAEKELDIKSPSKVGYGIGRHFGLGFVNAITDYNEIAYEASTNMAKSAREGLTNAIAKLTVGINDEMNCTPTIRPVLDLSSVESGANRLNSLFSVNRAMSVESSMKIKPTADAKDADDSVKIGKEYTFIQNNYSPKALSRLEIYRQTKNQISTIKGLV